MFDQRRDAVWNLLGKHTTTDGEQINVLYFLGGGDKLTSREEILTQTQACYTKVGGGEKKYCSYKKLLQSLGRV